MGDYEITADEVLGGSIPKANKLEQAKQLIRNLAKENEAMASGDILELAKQEGISKRTLDNAKQVLGVKAKRVNNGWHWKLGNVK